MVEPGALADTEVISGPRKAPPSSTRTARGASSSTTAFRPKKQHGKLTDAWKPMTGCTTRCPLGRLDQRPLASGLPFLATVGATAPFIGLFGTVVGIYRALIKIGIAGSASIDKVAGPVGEALIMTALGLLVAVPAVLAYNYLQARNKRSPSSSSGFSTDVLGLHQLEGARLSRQ
jgi:biopolymer transport protein ExbB